MEVVKVRYCCNDWKPIFAMLGVVVALGIMNILIKKAINEGFNSLVLITMRQLTATISLAPIAYFLERKSRPKLTTCIFTQLFLSGLLGPVAGQYLFFLGLRYASTTFACAFLNMISVLTFLIALPFGLEKLNLKNRSGLAKVFGTGVCAGGAMVLTFYKGLALTNVSSMEQYSTDHHRSQNLTGENHSRRLIVASIVLLSSCLCWSFWYLLQSRIGEKYPALFHGSVIMLFLSTLQSAALTFATQKGIALWVFRGKVEIIAVIYSGVVGSGLSLLVVSWCMKKRGPIFTAAFSPAMQVVVAIIDFSILHEQLHLGSVLGSVLVIVGLYFLLWGKSNEIEISKVVKQVERSGGVP